MNEARDVAVTPELVDAIGALGDETRLRILLELAFAERDHQQDRLALSFTALYEAVPVSSSSRFSYHLDKLVGPFVSEREDGYRLTHSGQKMVRVVLSGLYESTPAFDPRPVEGTCVHCESRSLVAALEDEFFRIKCDACESVLVTDSFPHSQTRGRDPDALVESFRARIWSGFLQARDAVCPECYGRIDVELLAQEAGGSTHYTHACACEECLFRLGLPVEVTAAFHPAALHLLWQHGWSLFDVPLWEFFELLTTDVITTDLVADDPPAVVCTVSVGDETRRLLVDDSMQPSLLTDDDARV
jgi:hypothetical protein